ncbi:hypothetical protein CF319_g7960 [Tilletia indica]|nr:hypothetical protein CF319_g7960 [Tilletia indica]
MISASGPGRGSGPSSAQTTRGHQQGTYLSCPSHDAIDQNAADDVLSSPHSQSEDIQPLPVLHLANTSWLLEPAVVPTAAPSLQKPRRSCTEVKMSRLLETGSGRGYERHAPTTCRLRFTGSDLPDVSSLIDTGASLSTIDRGLADRLGLTPQEPSLSINGIGTQRTLGYVTLPFYLEGTDAEGGAVRLHFDHDFHVLQNFAPGICLGDDWITGHSVVVDTAGGVATIGGHTFPVRGRVPHARTLSAKICTKKDTVIPPSCHAWVDVDTAALVEDVDYLLEPTFLHSPDTDLALTAVACVMDHSTSRLLVTNFGIDAFQLPSRSNLGQATALGPGVIPRDTGLTFHLEADSLATPLDPFDFDEQPSAAEANAASTTLVDDFWKVGVDSNGKPHPGVVEVLRRHRQAFALDGRPGHIRGVEMHIPVEEPSRLRAEPPRRVSPELRAVIEKQIAELLEWDVIEESRSPVSSAVHLVKQRDKVRFCVDYRHINSATTPDRYPLPRIDDVLESLRGARWFSSLDAIRGYHQMDVAEEDRWKTAFITHKGLYQYKRVPFGLRSAPAYFQRFMDGLLGPMRWITALVYLDDVVVYTKTLEDHLAALAQLLEAAERSGLRFSPAKCTFAVRELNLLGRKVSGHGLGIMEDRASAVLDLHPPRTLHELYHTLGLFTYYRQFIPRFSQIAKPLTDLTKGWSYKKVGSVHRLLDSDGAFVSARTASIPWTSIQQEAFETLKRAIAAPPTLAHPDYDRPFLLYTDACKTGFAAAVHQVSVFPAGPDAMAFPAWPRDPLVGGRDQWVTALRADPIFGPTIRRLESGGDHGPEEIYRLVDGVLLRRDDGRLCVPRSCLLPLLRSFHDEGGHFGFAKTYMRTAAEFWHPRLSSLVAAYIRHCATCLRTKTSRAVGRLDIDHDAVRPWQHTSIDVVLGLPRSQRGHDAIIIGTDTFSKMVLLAPCTSSFTARDITSFVLNRIVRAGWRPERLTSDHDLRIMGSACSQLGELLGMRVTPTPPHHHQANPVERQVQTLQRVLRAMVASGSGSWDDAILPAAELAMNSAPSLATGMTPFDAVYIDSPRALDTILSRPDHGGVGEWAERFAQAKARLLEAKTLIRAERLRQSRAYDDRHAPLPSLRPGDRVWVRLSDRPIGSAPSGKLAPGKVGPYLVRRILSEHRVLVDVPATLNIGDEFAVSQLELHPREEDPFHRSASPVRSPTAPRPPRSVSPPPSPAEPVPPRRGLRERRAAPILRDPMQTAYSLRASLAVPFAEPDDVFSSPRQRVRRTIIDGVAVQLVERPVAFLSRSTTSAEAKLTGPELELTCIAWAMTRAQHLLMGSQVTIFTDHAPVPGMLSSRTGQVPCGAVVERARVLLRPHLDRLQFVHKPGRLHINVDALSRLPHAQVSRDAELSLGGRVPVAEV